MSGGITLLPTWSCPWNRIVILLFSAGVLLGVGPHPDRLGLLVRAVTQDRLRAAGLGVRTPRVDLLAFAIGSGIAGLGGCAPRRSATWPRAGQGFIVDSFMVVVLRGWVSSQGPPCRGEPRGGEQAARAWAGAVMAKIVVLVFVILFIQRHPQGSSRCAGGH
jgi:urea transport system permease protein